MYEVSFKQIVGGSQAENKFAVFGLNTVTGVEYRDNAWEYDQISETITTEAYKIFVMYSNHQKRLWNSFYVRLANEENAPIITIVHPTPKVFSSVETQQPFFKARGHFLKREEVLSILQNKDSMRFFLTQQVWPRELLQRIITIERPRLKFEGGRKLIIRKEFRKTRKQNKSLER